MHMVLPLITASPNPEHLTPPGPGGAELHLTEPPFNRVPRTSALRSSEKFATKGPNITLLEDAQSLPAVLLWEQPLRWGAWERSTRDEVRDDLVGAPRWVCCRPRSCSEANPGHFPEMGNTRDHYLPSVPRPRR